MGHFVSIRQPSHHRCVCVRPGGDVQLRGNPLPSREPVRLERRTLPNAKFHDSFDKHYAADRLPPDFCSSVNARKGGCDLPASGELEQKSHSTSQHCCSRGPGLANLSERGSYGVQTDLGRSSGRVLVDADGPSSGVQCGRICTRRSYSPPSFAAAAPIFRALMFCLESFRLLRRMFCVRMETPRSILACPESLRWGCVQFL